MKSIDPRIAARRRNVAEQQARHGIRRMLWMVLLVAIVGAVLWVANSPYYSVQHIAVTGDDRSDITGALTTVGIVEGTALIRASISDATERILADPWVADARVVRLYPDTIEVTVVEHVPVAQLVTLNGTGIIAEDGSIVVYGGEDIQGTDGPLPVIRIGVSLSPVGEVSPDLMTIGAAEFLAGLEPTLTLGASVFVLDGELWAYVDGYDIRLGRPDAMVEKARSLAAVLEAGQVEGSVINVIAPARPTVLPPDIPSTDTTNEP